MKKARKKRIVRRKRRVSEREVMRIKRKLKKSARKLRLGAKRTGAYVYGTLRRIVGNPGGRYRVGGGYKTFTLDEAKREAERIFRTTGSIVSIEEHRPTPQVAPSWKYGIYTGRGVVRKNPNDYSIRDIKPGDHIQLHPGHDMWMRGARFGTVVGVGQKLIAVKLDGVRKYIKILPRHVGEIYPNRRLRGNPSVTMQDIQRIVGKINSEGGGARVVPAGSGGLNLYLDRISPYDGKTIERGHEYFLRGTKKDIYEALIKIRFVPMYHPYARGLGKNPGETDKIMKLRRILADRQYAKIDGQVVDGVTARAILMVYDGLNEKNRGRYSAMPIVKMANIAWKLVR